MILPNYNQPAAPSWEIALRNFEEFRKSPYTPKQLFAMVATVKQYPQFLPWCKNVVIHQQSLTEIDATLMVKFGIYYDSFRSKVALNEEQGKISITYLSGPFKQLTCHWSFDPLPEGEYGTAIGFDIGFEMKSKLTEAFVGNIIEKAFIAMVEAFEIRARRLFGSLTAEVIAHNGIKPISEI